MSTSKTRLHRLDTLRGILLVNMIAFHGLWDLVNLFGVQARWYTGTAGYLWQQGICWGFILLSGFCWGFSRSHLRRGLTVFGGGVVISLVTGLLMPENRILFGILTCIGSCVLLLIPLEKLLRKIPTPLGLVLSMTLFCLLRNCARGNLGFEALVITPLPDALYRNALTAYFGFPGPDFFSTDYFGLLPWFFLFVTGYFLNHLLTEKKLTARLFTGAPMPVLGWIGRHSLVVYLLHQPVLYGLCLAGQLLMQ